MKTKIYRPCNGVTIITTPDANGHLCIGVTVGKLHGPAYTHVFSRPKWFATVAHHWLYKWRWSPFPVYWDRYSRDCDQFAVEWCERHPNGWKAYASYCDALDNAEGPELFSPITKADWQAHKDERHTRDHAAEQMNY